MIKKINQLDLETIRNFQVVAETLHFRKAAESLYIAQPALSRQIQMLEKMLGVALFKRNNRRVALTLAGQHFMQETRRMLAQWDNICSRTAQIGKGEAGIIRIGHASSTMQSILPLILAEIRQQLPELKSVLSEINNTLAIARLRSREIDVAFAPNMLIPEDLASTIVYQENFVLLLPQNYPQPITQPVDLRQFAHDDFILPPKSESSGYTESLEQLCQQHGFTPHIVHESGNSNTVLRLVEAGIGISIEPKSTLRSLRPLVQAIELEHIPLKVEMRMVWLPERTEELQPFFEIVEVAKSKYLAESKDPLFYL